MLKLRQMSQALFMGGRDMLKKELEEILGGAIYEMSTDLDPLSGKKNDGHQVRCGVQLKTSSDRP